MSRRLLCHPKMFLESSVEMMVTGEEKEEKQVLLQTNLWVEALMYCLFLSPKGEMASPARGRGTQCVLLQKLHCLLGMVHVAGFALQALFVTNEKMTLVSQFLHQPFN